MYEQVYTLMHRIRLRYIVVPLFIVADLFLLSLLPAALIRPAPTAAEQARAYAVDASLYESPNPATEGITKLADGAKRVLIQSGQISRTILRTTGSIITGTTKAIGRSIQVSVLFVVHTIGTCATFVGKVIATSAVFLVRIPGNILGFVSNTATASPLTKPANHAKVPVIDLNSPAMLASGVPIKPAQAAAMPTPAPVTPVAEGAAVWPIHGQITTEYGVPHWPFQPTHTGLDISSGKGSGVMPVVPFKPGRVAATVYSNSSLGNRVVVDHGNGLSSLYGHLASISVQIGQEVTHTTVLGYEGSTGASTGTHLHLEIMVNGQLVNPHQYITGLP